MAKVIACCNAKGGTGKTTVAINLAACFAAHLNKKVLGIDLDPQGNFAVGLGIDPRRIELTSFKLLINDNPGLNGTPHVDDYIINVRPNFDLIPNALEPGMETQLSAKRNRERLLDIRLRPIRDRYDYIFLDTPPALETPTINAMVTADEILIVVDCGYYALYGLTQLMETVASVRVDFEKDELVIRGLLNYFDQRQNLDQEIAAEVENFFESLLLKSIVHKNIKLAESASAGKPIIEYNKSCSGYFDFMKLAKELINIYEKRRKAETQSVASRNR